jgi:hypothetical protein
MSWGKSGKKKKPATMDLRKKQSFFDTLKNRRTHMESDKALKCVICFKKIGGVPEFCDNYLTRSKRCNAGPFCSKECWDKHMEQQPHY